jgi:hypothetical protein
MIFKIVDGLRTETYRTLMALQKAFGCSRKDANQKLTRHIDNEVTSRRRTYKFPGPGQRETPIGPFNEFLELCSQLPGDRAKAMRKEQAQITTRAIAGDTDLVRAILAQKDNLSVY